MNKLICGLALAFQMVPPAGSTPPIPPYPLLGFQCQFDNNVVVPPDPAGAVGPNHIVSATNAVFAVYSKTGESLLSESLASFWQPLGFYDPIQPRVVFDPVSLRWYATAVTYSSNHVLLAVSLSDDPLGEWTYSSFDGGASSPEFPAIGFNSKWIAISANLFQIGVFVGTQMWVIDKVRLLDTGITNMVSFGPAFSTYSSSMQPCMTLDPDQETLYILDNLLADGETNLIRVSRITGPHENPTWSWLPDSPYNDGSFPVRNLFNFMQSNATQLGETHKILTDDTRLAASVFRNGYIWTCHSGGLPYDSTSNRTAVFWYQIDPSAAPSILVQSGVIDGGIGSHLFYPSIAANASNAVCVAFSRSDAGRYAEAAYCARLASDDAGVMGPVRTLKTGEDPYYKLLYSGANRWGNYSASTVDPVDDSFWTFQEYSAKSLGRGSNYDKWGIWASRLGTCLGDVNQDARIDLDDLATVLQNYGNLGSHEDGDLTGDGMIDLSDLSTFLSVYGAGCQ